MLQPFSEIPHAKTWTNIHPINLGWSSDKKYKVTDEKGKKYLLRLSDKSSLEDEKGTYQALKQLRTLDLPVSQLIESGICNQDENTYRLFSWIEGNDAREMLPRFSPEKQYEIGFQAGEILRQIHQIPAAPSVPDWATHFNQKIDRNIKRYYEAKQQFPDGEIMIQFLDTHRYLLENRPQCFGHGDYHIGNMVLTKEGKLGIIDFNRLDFGDPWEEFNRIAWCAEESGSFASGRINGYFQGENVPQKFFQLLALYVCSNQLGGLYWAETFGQAEVDTFLKQTREILDWFDYFRRYIPSWYINESFSDKRNPYKQA